ncbi:MAG: cysteine dioxygenase [Pseudomonadota bacterium]
MFVEEAARFVACRGGDAVAGAMVEPMARLVRDDAWLPDAMAVSHAKFYQQHLLYADPRDRFSVVSFVWGPGQATPIHNHTVWGVIGVLRGSEYSQRYEVGRAGRPAPVGTAELLTRGEVDIVSPMHGDIHRVRNAYADRVSISIHVYGANIGKVERKVFDPHTGVSSPFVSGYGAHLREALA